VWGKIEVQENVTFSWQTLNFLEIWSEELGKKTSRTTGMQKAFPEQKAFLD